ncbi:MAG TPA: hypothetical protein VIP77_21710 [Jiangellaceae bacterium]
MSDDDAAARAEAAARRAEEAAREAEKAKEKLEKAAREKAADHRDAGRGGSAESPGKHED